MKKTLLHNYIPYKQNGFFKGIFTNLMKKALLSAFFLIIALVFPVIGEVWGQSQTFTAGTSTFTVPAGVTSITIECWGGGGGGGSANTNNTGNAGGGGGGAYASRVFAVTPGTVYTNGVVVGAGGAAGVNGGNSSFNTNTVIASGGTGVALDVNAGGAGGTVAASTGTIRNRGGNGGTATDAASPAGISGGGGGGAGSTGNGGDAAGLTAGTGTANSGGDGATGWTGGTERDGVAGSPYGGGGSGAHCTDNSNHTGGAGASGLIVISWTQPIFYSQGSVTPNTLTNWNTNPGGGGYSPTNFTANYQTFVVQSGHTMTTTAAWNVSGINSIIRIASGGILTENNNITLAATGTLQVDNGGRLNHNVNATTIFTGTETFGTTSTVNFGFAGNQSVLDATYGNLVISGGGTKTILGDATVNTNLALNNGNLSLGSGASNLTIGDGATITTSGTFNNSHMIICDGGGSLIKLSNTAAGFVIEYPVGTNGYYTPFQISALSASVAGTGSVNIRAVAGTAPGPPAANSTDLQKYWIITTQNLSAINANASFTYVNPNEVGTGGDQSSYVLYRYDGIEWKKSTGASAGGINPMTITNTSTLTGTWTGRETPATFYTYQSGDWGTATTWTTDPSGTLSVNPAVPGPMDRVVILNGRTVATSTGYSVLSTQINEGGFLDIGNTTGHVFGDVRGKGRLRLSTGTFPGGTFTDFVAAEGGTVEYYNTANFTLSQYSYNNLIFNLSGSGIVGTVLGNLIVNGYLTVQQGDFRINSNASTTRLDLIVYGDVLIEANGRISLGTGNIGTATADAHRFTIRGDFTNNGEARFTNLAAANYFTYPNHRVDVVFDNPSANQDMLLNGYTRFYRIEIDKGTDQTYVLNIDAAAANQFYLFGRNDLMGVTPAPDAPNINNLNALGLMTGTLRLGANINVPSLAEESAAGLDLNYHVDEDACFWIDGASVTHTTNANGGNSNSFVLYGKLRMSNAAGTFNINDLHGIVMRANASIEIEDGTLTTPCIRTSTVAGTHRGSYNQSGGNVTITGNIAGSGDHASLSLTWPGMSFKMSGGNLNINQATSVGGNGQLRSLVIGANAENISVTGGTVTISIANRNTYFTSTAPFWNLIIDAPNTTYSSQIVAFTGSASASAVALQPLVVYNNFSLTNSAIFIPNDQNVTVGGDFLINTLATYTPGTNITTFNGAAGQTFTNSGTITTGLYNLDVTNHSNTSITQNLIVRNNLSIGSTCFLQDMGRTISVNANITNSGTHTSQAGGGIIVNGGGAQSIGGDGNGVFGNLVINKAAGTASFTAKQTLTGNLRLVNGLLNISTFNLSLGDASNVYDALYPATTAVFSGTKMIRTSGNMSDGGVTKEYSSTGAFVFPVGTASDYTPATIQFNAAPSAWGSLNVKPVTQYNPFVTSTNSLNYYWKVTQSGFSGITSVSHTYRYVDADLVGRGTEANYIPGVYNPFSWVYINDISQVVDASNDIRFNTVSYASGDFTAGELNAFQPVAVYYSCTNGDWNSLATWSTTSNAGPADATVLPGSNNPVVIGDGGSNNHTVTVPGTYNNIIIGGLQINSGSVLDITTSTGHNFGSIPDSKVTGTGRLKISSGTATAAFPGGDFGNFLTTGGGTVEYYNTGAQDFTIPTTNTYYNNLIFSPTAGRYISMPNIDLTVYGDYTISGADISGIARLNATAVRTLTVEGNINITGGTLQYYNGTAQTVYANNDINISGGAAFNVRNGGTAVTNLLYIDGNLNNNGTFDMYTSATLIGNVYFTGDADKVISGAGTNDFNILTVNKGTSRNTILDVTANNLTLSYTGGAALVLSNGTFRVSNALLAFTLSTTTSFIIPTSAALSVNEGTVTIGTTNNAGDLILAGRLEIINNGIVNIGNGGNYNNDIEYASGGSPEIILSGNGILTVNGQIRRPTTITTGSINYTQGDNSQVIIAGRQAVNTRGMVEILNSGSSFNMSGGTLTIYRNFNDVSCNELYLVPETSEVTGGTISLGSSAVINGTVFNFASSVPIWNLRVDATSTIKTVNQRIYSLTILNNLLIQGGSDYKTNGLNVTIGGTLANNNSSAGTGVSVGGYQAGTSTQVTTFSGSGTQRITGSGANLTNFANLVIEPSTTLTLSLNSNIRVNSNLTLSSGSFIDGSNEVTVMGNIYNSAIHTSPSTTGGIILYGSQKQTISGSGTGEFGNITLNNSLGIEMVDNSIINGQLTFSSGKLYIDDYMLTLGTNATIAGTPDENNMIMLNGVVSDQGVKKLYPASAADFTFPIGVAGKFTPVRYNVTANGSSGTILIRPVNYKHPSTYESPAATNELQYYWYAVSTGFSGLAVDHTYNYMNDDALPNETDYVVGRYNPITYTWSVPAEGLVNASSDNFTITGVGYIDGEYTCGVNIAPSPNFQDMPIYYSRNVTSGGNWTDPNAWTLNSDGSGGPAPSYPRGNPTVILATHTITMNANSQTAYSVEIVGTLAVGTTLYHSLGHIRGGGTINLTSTASGSFIFPAGVYDEFMANASSTIEFYNNSAIAATLPLKPGNYYKPYQNVIFSGTGVKYMSAENMKVLGNFTISGGTLNNTLHNRNIMLLGNWTDNNTAVAGGFVPGTGRVILNGNAAKLMTITGASTVEQFYNLQINNAAGATISGGGQVTVSKYLYLTLGNITTTATNLLSITNTSTSAAIGGGSTSFVNGPLRKSINSGSYFNFPVGNNSGTRYGNLYVSTVSLAGSYTAQYYNHNPGTDGYDPDSVVNPIDAVSDVEYWRVNGPSANANVRVRWDAQSGIIPADAASRQKLRIVEWNGTAWQNRGNVIVDGGVNSGTIQTSPVVNVNGNHYFTIGAESLPTANITSGDSSICDDGSTTSISIDLTGTAPWTIHYKVNGANETTINNIATSPYTIVISNAIEPLASQGPGSYIFNVSYIRDATGSTGVRDFTKTATITLNESPNPVISGNQTVAVNENNVIYNTTLVGGHTYLWSYSGTAGTTHNGVLTGNALDMHWGTAAGTGWVQVIETLGSCITTTAQYSVTITDTPNPLVTGDSTVCNGVTETYRTAKVGTHTYAWTLPLGGGSVIGATNRDSVVVNWTATGSRSVQVAETGSSTVTDALNITVSPLPAITNVVTDPSICNGQTASIIVQATAAGISYQLRLNSDDSNVGLPVSSGPGGDISLPASPVVTTIYNVLATNEFNCSSQLTDLSTVTVDDPPTASAGSDESICAGSTFDLSSSTTPPSAASYSSLSWSSSGTGGFSDNTILQPIYTPSAADITAGSVGLTLTANGNGACGSVNDAMSLIINAAPSPTITGLTDLCEESTTTLDAGAGYSSYAWSFGATSLGSGQTQSVTTQSLTAPTNSVVETYTVVVTNAAGCSGTDTHDITVHRIPDTGPDYYIPNP